MAKVLARMSLDLPVLYQNLSYDVSGYNNEKDAYRHFAKTRSSAKKKGLHALLFDDHTRFPDANLMSGCTGFRVVRDPRDVVISSANYHLVSNEQWLHVPRKEFGGLTYFEKIRSFNTFKDRIQFEMEHSAASNIRKMASFENNEVFETVKYEDLILDVKLEFWSGLMERLELDPYEIEKACRAFLDCSLFGGLKGQEVPHVADGGVEQWKKKFDDSLRQLVEDAFAREMDSLGYAR